MMITYMLATKEIISNSVRGRWSSSLKVIGDLTEIHKNQLRISKEFEIKICKPSYFVGIEITENKR